MRKIKKCVQVKYAKLNTQAMVLEPLDTLNEYNRREKFQELIQGKAKEKELIPGKATFEGLNYFKSRNIEGIVKSS